MSTRVDLKIDVTKAVPLAGPLEIAATVYLPSPEGLPETPVVIFASPGGGYSRGYFDLHFEGHENYSQAEYHTARRAIFVAYDHLGVGDSSTHQNHQLTFEMLADGNDSFVREIIKRLALGTLSEGFPKLDKLFTVGTGQSLGAGITIIMQGRCGTFDAVGILGVSAIHTQLPQPTFEAARYARDPFRFTRSTPLARLSLTTTSAQVPDFVYPFHWEDEPRDILDADMKGGYPKRETAPYFGSKTIPICAVAANSPGFFTPEASMIEVPVLIAVGERDVCPDPWREPSAYWRSPDVSLYVVLRMAHMHNFASTRDLLWWRLHQWSLIVSGANPGD